MGQGKLLEWRDDSLRLKRVEYSMFKIDRIFPLDGRDDSPPLKWVRVGASPLDKKPYLPDLTRMTWVGDSPFDDDTPDSPDLTRMTWVGASPFDNDTADSPDLTRMTWVGASPFDHDTADSPDLTRMTWVGASPFDHDTPDSTPFALMFNGPFEKAREAANAQDRWLLVNVQSTKEFSSHKLNRDTWGNEAVAQTITSNFIFCQIYDHTEEGSKISTYYRLDSLPVTIVIDPITGQKMRLWRGMIHPESLLADLLQFIDGGSPKEHHASSSNKRQREISQASPPKIQEETIEDDEDMKLARALSMGTMGADSEPSCNTDSHNDTNTKSNVTLGIGVSEDELGGQLLSAFADMKQSGCKEIDCEQLGEIFKQQAMLLDPTNESVRENVQAAERKVWQQRGESSQDMKQSGCKEIDCEHLAEIFKQEAMLLDPTNESVRENVQVAERKVWQQSGESSQDMENSGYKEIDLKNLADTFKLQGNKAMQSKLYAEAIELYTAAIALRGDNAIYYCNRAAAYTQTCQYAEAILDCQKSLVIDPKYIKAYSRLGYIYYAQGKYTEALEKGYRIAMLLDPTNESVRENVRAAERKVWQQREESGQNSYWSYPSGVMSVKAQVPPCLFGNNCGAGL